MNAGANAMETKNVLTSVGFVHADGRYEEISIEELNLTYRSSRFHSMKGAIVSAQFSLQSDPAAKKKQIEIIDYRTSTQPYGEKTCGCAFKNPEGDAAGRLIEKSGLKGFVCGDAMVSPTHANFIVNQGNATAQNILDLIKYIKIKVYILTGKSLEPEVKFIPFREDDSTNV